MLTRCAVLHQGHIAPDAAVLPEDAARRWTHPTDLTASHPLAGARPVR